MKKINNFTIILTAFGLICFIMSAEAEDFIYDAQTNRDPFWPLVTDAGSVVTYDGDYLIADLHLEGIVVGASDNLAIINGKVVQAGKTIGAFTVNSVGEDSVELIKDSQKFQLKLKKEE